MKVYKNETHTIIGLFSILFLFSSCHQAGLSKSVQPTLQPEKNAEAVQDPLKHPFLSEACSNPEDCYRLGMESDAGGNHESAKAYFETLLNRYPDSSTAYEAGYLLAKWEVETKSYKGAWFLDKIKAGYRDMGDYVSKLYADDVFNRGEFQNAADLYGQILINYPQTVLRPLILLQRGESFLQLNERRKALESFETYGRENPREDKTPEVLYKTGDLYFRDEEWDTAAKIFREIEWRYPDTPPAVEAEKKLAQIRQLTGDREKFTLSRQERFSKGKALFETGKFEKAIETWTHLEKQSGKPEPFQIEMELRLGQAYLNLRRYDEASDKFHLVLKTAPGSDFSAEALTGLVRRAIREENEPEILKYQRKAGQLFSKKEVYYRLLYLIGNYYEDHQQIEKAHSFYQGILRELPQGSVAPDALWKEGWISYFTEKDYPSAVKVFDTLIHEYPASALHAQALYWKGRSLELLDEKNEAQAVFVKLCDVFSHSYYCHIARKHLSEGLPAQKVSLFALLEGGASPDQGASQSLPEALPGADAPLFLKDEHYFKAKELLKMNLVSEAAGEFNFLADHYRDRVSLLQIDRELIQTGDFYHALKNLNAQFPDILQRGKSYDLPGLWVLAYPKEVIDQIARFSKDLQVEPQFVAGIMREESVFDQKATSRSGAIGLMQLMPFTGEQMAQKLGVPFSGRDQLYNQEMNIRVGAYYLDILRQRFQGNLFYTAAGYNAGPEAVTKWIANGNYSEVEEFVENIPYQETRYYVKRVIKSYEEFKTSSAH